MYIVLLLRKRSSIPMYTICHLLYCNNDQIKNDHQMNIIIYASCISYFKATTFSGMLLEMRLFFYLEKNGKSTFSLVSGLDLSYTITT